MPFSSASPGSISRAIFISPSCVSISTGSRCEFPNSESSIFSADEVSASAFFTLNLITAISSFKYISEALDHTAFILLPERLPLQKNVPFVKPLPHLASANSSISSSYDKFIEKADMPGLFLISILTSANPHGSA